VLSAALAAGALLPLGLPGSGPSGGAATAARPDQATAPPDTTTGTTTTAPPQTTPAPAGPALTTDLPCYLEDRSVALSGSGLPAGAAYTVSLDGAPLGSGKVNPDGTLTGKLASGRVITGATHLRHTVSVTVAGSAQPLQASFYVTRFGASFAPDAGNPTSLVVRYSVFGFGIGPAAPKDPTPRPLYLHYIAPTGVQIALVKLGRTHGFCGSLPLTRTHHLFLFHPGPGTWHLQFDTSLHWSAASRPRVVRAVVVR
jgi:hypothetical protein